MSDESELQYWRALAEERGRELDTLRGRVEAVAALANDARTALLSAGLSAAWLEQLQSVHSPELEPGDVATVLGELWSRVKTGT